MSKIAVFVVLYCVSAAAVLFGMAISSQPSTNNVTLTGTVSCGRCQNIQPPPKGYTRFSWALHSISEGDDVVLFVAGKTYRLQGDRNQLLKYVGNKTTINGSLEGTTLVVQMITRPGSNR